MSSEYYEIEINLQEANLVAYESDQQDQDDAVGWLGEPTHGDTAVHTFTGVGYSTTPMVTIVQQSDWIIMLDPDTDPNPVNDGAGTVTVTLKSGLTGSDPALKYKVRISEA